MAINFIHISYKSLSFLDAVTSLLIPVVFLTFKLIFESSMDIMFNLLMQHWNGFGSGIRKLVLALGFGNENGNY